MYFDVLDYDGSYELSDAVDQGERLKKLDSIVVLVKKALGTKAQLFSVLEVRGGRVALKATALGERLMQILKEGEVEFSPYFQLYDLNPYVSLLYRCADRVKSEQAMLLACLPNVDSSEIPMAVTLLNRWVGEMRQEAEGREFKKELRRFVKAARKRRKSLSAYVDALFAKYSRLAVINLELSYRCGYFRGRRNLEEALAEVKGDWVRLRRDLHMGVPVCGMVGIACKLEYTHLTGFHFHLLVFYDGSKHWKDIALARSIGEHWRCVVAQGKGRYFNCNAVYYPERLIGNIGAQELERILRFKEVVVGYLVKEDYLRAFSDKCGRTFFRGDMPKPRKDNRGRPRALL